MTAPAIIQKLIERFEEQRDSYLAPAYNETQVRRDFIDPFFKALGWDIDNENDHAEAYRDVIHEDRVLVNAVKNAPDYSFRVGGTRKFFVEAKKPSVSIATDAKAALQIRRYGWSAKLPVSILTDFEEFAVYDCTHKPEEGHKAGKSRLFYYRYTDYIEKWEEIAGIFSKEAILKGSFDRFASSKKRGSTTVDETFLAEIESWRADLAANILLNNDTSQRDLNSAVQLTIDRIIFLRICEDRGIEPYERLLNIAKGKNVYQRLGAYFKDADDRFNSGLFHFDTKEKHASDADTVTLKLKIDDVTLKTIIASLYPPNPYEFSVIPADILGQVYERFLGNVIEVDGKVARVKEKPEVKRAGGVYYTPEYVAEHIVTQTVGRLVDGKTPKQVARLKILDPACGSGSFLIVAYQYLLDWHLSFYKANGGSKKFKKELHQTEKGDLRLTTQVRKSILLNNIFGVDIDPQAVEVTKLSLLLKVLEGESGEAIGKNLQLFHERALPDLGDNIKCGNSLVEDNFYDQQDLPNLSEDEVYRINTFEWSEQFNEIMDSGKFDVVLGNPPYGATLFDPEKIYLKSFYADQSYQLDSYLLFIELSIKKLLKKDGYWGMIIPNPWLTNIRQDRLRRLVLGSTRIDQIVHFKYQVFKKAIVDTEIVIFQNGYKKGHEPSVMVVDAVPQGKIPEPSAVIKVSQDQWLEACESPINIFLSPEERALRERIFAARGVLADFYKVNVGIKPYQTGKGRPPQTPDDVVRRVFDSSKPLKGYRQYLRGKDFVRYAIRPVEKRYLKYGEWLAEPRPAAKFDAAEKILVRQTADEIIAAADLGQFLCLNNVHVLVAHSDLAINVHAMVALLNSKLITWCLRAMNPEEGEALAEVKKEFVERLPVPGIDEIRELTTLGQKIYSIANKTVSTAPSKQMKAVVRQIDSVVYRLYNVTKEEQDLIERRRPENGEKDALVEAG